MATQPKQAPINVSKSIANWAPFYNNSKNKNLKAICLFGSQNAGKSTLCVLFEKFIEGKQNANLTFEDTKVKLYNYLGVISSNSLKIQTVQPQVYHIDSKVQNLPNTSIIDIPTCAIPPINDASKKLWSALDSKIGFAYLLNTVKQCSIALVVEQRLLRNPIDSAKALFINFVTSFAQLSPELLESTAIIISKCPNAYQLETGITRIEGCFSKIKQQPLKNTLTEWFQNIKQRNAIFLFNKFSQHENERKEEILNIYKQLTSLKYSPISQKNRHVFDNLSDEHKNEIKKYLDGFKDGFSMLIQLCLEIAESFVKDSQSFQKMKDNIAVNLNNKGQEEKEEKVQSLKLPQILNIAFVCYKIKHLINTLNFSPKIFIEILQLFEKHQILSQGEDLYISLSQRAEFYQTFVAGEKFLEWDEQNVLKVLQGQLNKIKDIHNFQNLRESYENLKQNQSKDFFQNVVQIYKYLNKSEDNDLSDIYIDSRLQLTTLLPDPQALKNLLELQVDLKQKKKFEMLRNLFGKIAQILISSGYVAQAVRFYNKCGDPYKALTTMENITQRHDLKKKYAIKDFLPYLTLLQELGLYEKSYQTCYFLGGVFQQDTDRPKLKDFLKNSPKSPEQKYIESFINNQITGLDENEEKRLKQIVSYMESK